MRALYLGLTLLAAALLLLLLRRPGRGQPMSIWLLAALIPLLAAVTVALGQRP